MIWVLLIAITPNGYTVGGLFPSYEECDKQVKIELDKCVSAEIKLVINKDKEVIIKRKF
jgi:hypothetical protein